MIKLVTLAMIPDEENIKMKKGLTKVANDLIKYGNQILIHLDTSKAMELKDDKGLIDNE